jgi:hypothetical protein
MGGFSEPADEIDGMSQVARLLVKRFAKKSDEYTN